MSKKKDIIDKLSEQGLMPLYFHEDEATSIEVMDALYSAGVRLIEYTNRGEAALKNFTAMKKSAVQKYPGLFLGAGTIKNGESAKAFIDAGADFLISPGLVKEVHTVSEKENVLWMPGCMTPTEILKAEKFEVPLVKLFPGSILGPSFMQAIKKLFPQMKFMPTGGVETTTENLKAWFDAGVCAVGMGSKLLTKNIIANKQYEELTSQTNQVLAIIKDCKK